MIQLNGLSFCTTIGLLFALKEQGNHKTLDETYKVFERTDMDTMLQVLLCSYNRENKEKRLSLEQFWELLEQKEVGFVKLSELYAQVVEQVLFSGFSPQEVQERKKQLANMSR